MTLENAYARIRNLPEVAVDAAIGVALTALTWLQVAGFARVWRFFGPPVGMPARPRGDGLFAMPADLIGSGERVDYGVWPYVVVALVFLPLAFRRKWPVAVLVATSAATLCYLVQHWPPTFVVFGVMIALATVASRSSRGRTSLYVVVLIALVVLGSAIIYSDYSNARWIGQAVGMAALLIASSLFGDAMRSRREYVEEVEQHFREAERVREEEALRRVGEERIRIARDVHDIVAHSLAVVTVQAQAGLSTVEKDPAQTQASLETIRDTGKSALTELRSMLDVLRTGDSDAPRSPGVTLADLDDLAETVRESGVAVDLTVSGDVEALPEFMGLSAFRIAQEALTNVMRHSQASRAEVVARVSRTELLLEVSDDGRGPSDELEDGHGIQGMRERAAALGGTLVTGPAGEGGLRITATIPIPRSAR